MSRRRRAGFTPYRPAGPDQAGLVQRACACGRAAGLDGECEVCREKRLQGQSRAEPAFGNKKAPGIVHEALRSPGRPLNPATRATMERRLGHDFSRVRIHSDEQAAESARAVNARAYAVGDHVVFAAGQYQPATPAGRALLAHELAHVAQQGGALPADLRLDDPGSPAEREARAVGEAVGAGASVQPVETAGVPVVARTPADPSYVMPRPNILAIMNAMGDELDALRANASQVNVVVRDGEEEFVPVSAREQAQRTFCVVKVVDQDGTVKTSVTGAFFRKGPHAEEDALSKLNPKAIKPTDSVLVMVDQYPCEGKCTSILHRFRGQIEGEFRVFHKIVADWDANQVINAPKTVATQKPGGTSLVELNEFHRGPKIVPPGTSGAGPAPAPKGPAPTPSPAPGSTPAAAAPTSAGPAPAPTATTPAPTPAPEAPAPAPAPAPKTPAPGTPVPSGDTETGSVSAPRPPAPAPKGVTPGGDVETARARAPKPPAPAPQGRVPAPSPETVLPELPRATPGARPGAEPAGVETRRLARSAAKEIEAESRALRAGRVLTGLADLARAMGDIAMAAQFTRSAESALAGNGFVLKAEIKQAERWNTELKAQADAYPEVSDAISRSQPNLWRAALDPQSAGAAAAGLDSLLTQLITLQGALKQQRAQLEAVRAEASAKHQYLEGVLKNPTASAVVGTLTEGTGMLATFFIVSQDMRHIEGAVRGAIAAIDSLEPQIAADIEFLAGWKASLFETCVRGGACAPVPEPPQKRGMAPTRR